MVLLTNFLPVKLIALLVMCVHLFQLWVVKVRKFALMCLKLKIAPLQPVLALGLVQMKDDEKD